MSTTQSQQAQQQQTPAQTPPQQQPAQTSANTPGTPTQTSAHHQHAATATPAAPATQQLSPMRRYTIDAVDNIGRGLATIDSYVNKYSDIVNNIIPSLNKQIKSFERNGKAAIRREILSTVMGLIDFDTLADRLRADCKNKRPVSLMTPPVTIPPITNKLAQLDTDAFDNLYSEIDDPKEFKSTKKVCTAELTNVAQNVAAFEDALVQYRMHVTNLLLGLQDALYEHHYNYALGARTTAHQQQQQQQQPKKIQGQKLGTQQPAATPPPAKPYEFDIAGRHVVIPVGIKKQREFIEAAYKQLVETQ